MTRNALIIALVVLILSACGQAKPLVDDIPEVDEIPPGPGLFSGKDGTFVLYGESEGEESP